MRCWLAPFALASAMPAVAAVTAVPPPPHFRSVVERQDDEFYRAVPSQRGIFAHGVAGAPYRAARDGPACAGSDTAREQFVQTFAADGPSEYWFYATRSQGVLFTRTIKFDAQRPCTEAPRYRYSIERAFVADGFIHSGVVGENNLLEQLTTWPFDHSADEYSGSFMRLHSLMARPAPNPHDRNLGSNKVDGITATCRGFSGIVWHSVCTADSGPAKGMILSAGAGDDEQIMFSTEVKELRPNAVLPGIVFETDRQWMGAD